MPWTLNILDWIYLLTNLKPVPFTRADFNVPYDLLPSLQILQHERVTFRYTAERKELRLVGANERALGWVYLDHPNWRQELVEEIKRIAEDPNDYKTM